MNLNKFTTLRYHKISDILHKPTLFCLLRSENCIANKCSNIFKGHAGKLGNRPSNALLVSTHCCKHLFESALIQSCKTILSRWDSSRHTMHQKARIMVRITIAARKEYNVRNGINIRNIMCFDLKRECFQKIMKLETTRHVPPRRRHRQVELLHAIGKQIIDGINS